MDFFYWSGAPVLLSEKTSLSYISVKAGFHQRQSRSRKQSHKSAYDVVSRVISVVESESEESERFHFLRLCLRLCQLGPAYDLVKTRLPESEAEVEE